MQTNGTGIRRILVISENDLLLVSPVFRAHVAELEYEIRTSTIHVPQDRHLLNLESACLFWERLGLKTNQRAEVVVVVRDIAQSIASPPAGVHLRKLHLPGGDSAPIDPFDFAIEQTEWLPEQLRILQTLQRRPEPVLA